MQGCLVLALADDDLLTTRAGIANITGKFSCGAGGTSSVDRWGDRDSATHLNTSHAAADTVPVVQGGARPIGVLVVGP